MSIRFARQCQNCGFIRYSVDLPQGEHCRRERAPFRAPSAARGARPRRADVIALEIVAMGRRASEAAARERFAENRYQDYLDLHSCTPLGRDG